MILSKQERKLIEIFRQLSETEKGLLYEMALSLFSGPKAENDDRKKSIAGMATSFMWMTGKSNYPSCDVAASFPHRLLAGLLQCSSRGPVNRLFVVESLWCAQNTYFIFLFWSRAHFPLSKEYLLLLATLSVQKNLHLAWMWFVSGADQHTRYL